MRDLILDLMSTLCCGRLTVYLILGLISCLRLRTIFLIFNFFREHVLLEFVHNIFLFRFIICLSEILWQVVSFEELFIMRQCFIQISSYLEVGVQIDIEVRIFDDMNTLCFKRLCIRMCLSNIMCVADCIDHTSIFS